MDNIRQNNLNDFIKISKKELLNKIQVLFWEWNFLTDNVNIQNDNFLANNFAKLKSQISRSEFLEIFNQESRNELSKTLAQYLKKEIKSHKFSCKIKLDSDNYFTASNFGYLASEGNKVIVRGVLLKFINDAERTDNIEEIKKNLTYISTYTEEEFWIRDLNFNFLFISKPYSEIFDFSAEELLQTPLEKIFTPESIYYIQHTIDEELEFQQNRKSSVGKNLVLTLKGYKKNGNQIWTENSLNFIKDAEDKIIGIWGITRDITNRIKTDQIKEALYKISEYSHLTEDLNDFFAEIHSVIKAIMPANNFCICLYDKENDHISCPYRVDTKQPKFFSQNISCGLIEYLIKADRSLFLDYQSIDKLIKEQKIEPINPIPLQWLGIPLRIKNEVKGVLIVYTYEQSEKFFESDFENLKFVADQTSMVIERKLNETEKQKIKSLLEAVSKAQSLLLTKYDIHLGIQQAFELIGRIINVSRISLYENNTDATTNKLYAKLIIEWASRNEYLKGKIERLDYSPNLERWLKEFNLGNFIKDKINSISFLEYELLKDNNAQSILCIPIFLTKKLWGFIKFDDCKNERLWTEQEISVLSVVAASIGGIFQRKIAQETLKTSEEKYRNFINNSMEGISLLQFSEPIDINLPVEEQIDNIYKFGFIAEANESLAKMYGLSSTKEIVGKSLINIHGDSNNEINRKAFRDFILNGYKTINVETVELKSDGTEIIILNNSVGIIANNKLKAIWGSQIDITERKIFEQELKIAKEKAELANKIKSNFLSNMSHELRTPLIGVLGYAEILIEELNNTPYSEMASIIFQSGNRLLETLNSILTISKIESEKLDVRFAEFDLKDIIKEVVLLFHSLAVKKNLNIITHYSNEEMIIYSDSKIIREILNNLVNNAIKFTPSGSVTIEAIINSQENKLFLSVKDTGIGISEENLGIVFEEFRQASEGFSRSFEGVGIGLSICRKYVEILNGRISVKSKLNEGSTFLVEIPLTKN